MTVSFNTTLKQFDEIIYVSSNFGLNRILSAKGD